MRVGILGSGLMGGKLGTSFARAGHDVAFSYSRSERKLKRLAREAKGSARLGTPREAAQAADAVLLAVHWSRMDDVLNQAGGLSGKVVVTCSLPMNDDDTELGQPRSRSSGLDAIDDRVLKPRHDRATNLSVNAREYIGKALYIVSTDAPTAARNSSPRPGRCPSYHA